MAETQLKLAEAEKNIYWLTFVRSPGRGSSVCRHSWISDLPASVSVSFSLSFCVCLYLSLSLPPLLHLPLFSHHVDLISFLYKRLRERWQCLHGPWFVFVFVFCWGSQKKKVGLPPCSSSVLTRLYQRLRWSTCHPWTNHCDWHLNSLIGQVPVRSPVSTEGVRQPLPFTLRRRGSGSQICTSNLLDSFLPLLQTWPLK